MKNPTTIIKLTLGALALCACTAAHAAAPVITEIVPVPQFTVQSDWGTTNTIQYSTTLSQGSWLPLTNLVAAESPQWFVDVAAPPAAKRFYRVAATTTPSGRVRIPADLSFVMGNSRDSKEGDSDEGPTHYVDVSPFDMDTNLVSYMLWRQVYLWAKQHDYSFDNEGSGKAPNHPVQMVNWYDVVKWCNARSEKEGLTRCYYTSADQTTPYQSGQVDLGTNFVKWSASGYRLPTEAEWEKAARAGADRFLTRFPWSDGDTIDWSRANYYAVPGSPGYDVNPTGGENPAFSSGSVPYTSPVGYFAPNGYGLYDMAGNVWQWCWDWCGGAYYSSSTFWTNPRGPASGSERVLRGGGWGDIARELRCANRYSSTPSYSNYSYVGFRCVRGL
jgi:formylglycine-generating enzyme